jgi:hypothetical protein
MIADGARDMAKAEISAEGTLQFDYLTACIKLEQKIEHEQNYARCKALDQERIQAYKAGDLKTYTKLWVQQADEKIKNCNAITVMLYSALNIPKVVFEKSVQTHMKDAEKRASLTKALNELKDELIKPDPVELTEDQCMDAIFLYHKAKVHQCEQLIALLSSGKAINMTQL